MVFNSYSLYCCHGCIILFSLSIYLAPSNNIVLQEHTFLSISTRLLSTKLLFFIIMKPYISIPMCYSEHDVSLKLFSIFYYQCSKRQARIGNGSVLFITSLPSQEIVLAYPFMTEPFYVLKLST